jgi:hypothetical protein
MLHGDLYQGLKDAITVGNNNVVVIGQKIILPFSFIGGPRHMV